MVVLALRGALTLVEGPDGSPVPLALLENATWRGAHPALESELLTVAATIAVAPPPVHRPTPGRDGRGKVQRLSLPMAALKPLTPAFGACPYPLGGRWPLLEPLLALLQEGGSLPRLPLKPLGPLPPEGFAEAPAVALRRQWEGLLSGRPMGGSRKLPRLSFTGTGSSYRWWFWSPLLLPSTYFSKASGLFTLVERHPRRSVGGPFPVPARKRTFLLKVPFGGRKAAAALGRPAMVPTPSSPPPTVAKTSVGVGRGWRASEGNRSLFSNAKAPPGWVKPRWRWCRAGDSLSCMGFLALYSNP